MDPYRDNQPKVYVLHAPLMKKILWLISGKYFYLKYVRRILNRIPISKFGLFMLFLISIAVSLFVFVGVPHWRTSAKEERRLIDNQYQKMQTAAHNNDTIRHEFCYNAGFKHFVKYDDQYHIVTCSDDAGQLKEMFCMDCVKLDEDFNKEKKTFLQFSYGY